MEIGSIFGSGAQAGPSNSGALGQLGSDAFLKLMVAQLRYQNPMSPSDPSAMLEQTANFTQVETMQKLASLSQQLAGLQQTAIATNLVGQQVSANGPGGEITGTVDGVRFTAQGPMLKVGDQEVPLTATTSVRTPAKPA